MGNDRLKIDNEQMHVRADAIQDAISTYQGFSRTPFDTEIGYLEEMNTDFLAKFKTMLEDLNDSNPKLLESLEDIGELTQEIVDTFEELDEKTASEMDSRTE